MVQTKFTIIFLSILLAESLVAFKVQDFSAFNGTNTILRQLIYESDNLHYISNLSAQLTDINVSLTHAKDLVTFWVNTVKVGETSHQVTLPINGQEYNFVDNLLHLLKTFDDKIIANFAVKIKTNLKIMKDADDAILNLFRYARSLEIIDAIKNKRISLNHNNETFVKDITDAIEQYTTDRHRSMIINKEALSEYIQNHMATVFKDKLKFIDDYLEFKFNSVDLLYNFAATILNGLFNDTIKWTDNTIEQFKLIFTAIYNLDKRSTYSNLETISKFAREHLFNHINEDNKIHINMLTMFFSFFTLNYNTDICQLGRNLFLNYIFSNNFDGNITYHREYILKKDYKLKLKVAKTQKPLLNLDNLIGRVDAADFLWTIKSCVLSEADFNNLMRNISLFKNFDTSYVLYINQGDKYFNVNQLHQKKYVEIYRALYNVMLHSSVNLVDKKINELNFVEDFESFVTLSKAKKLRFKGFEINIEEFYPVFKLINIRHNMDYFANKHSKFLRFDKPRSYILTEFIDTLKNMKEMLDDWKNLKVNSLAPMPFDLHMLSDETIVSDVVQKYLDGNRGGLKRFNRVFA